MSTSETSVLSASESSVRTFTDLGVRKPLVRALAARGIVRPFPIQAASLPDALAGRDVLGRGRTGSGKTVAFTLPILEQLLSTEEPRRPRRPAALVLVPTRELAVQVHETIDYLARAVGLRAMTVFGGVRYNGQVRKLDRGVDIVIATPGRLQDLVEQEHVIMDSVSVVVLDEADLMADMGFLPAVTKLLDMVPSGGQRMLFSATLDEDVEQLVKRFLSDPHVHSVSDEDAMVDAEHFLFLVKSENKAEIIEELLTGGGRALAFMRTKFGAERLAKQLNEAGITAVDLHGNLKQGARQRHLSSFADGSVSVLVATDIAARGIHVDDIGLVVHIDPPNDPKAFLHRSGRTARAGNAGTVVTLATRNQNKTVRALMGKAKIKPKQLVVVPGDEILTELRAPKVEKASAPSIFVPDPEDVEAEEPREERFGRRRDAADRQSAWGRDDRRERPSRPAHRSPGDRKPAWGRDDRRGPRREWDDRPRSRAGEDRPKRWEREDRAERPAWREDRPRRWEDRPAGREDRPRSRAGEDRPKRWEREERPARRDDRPRRWEDRPAGREYRPRRWEGAERPAARRPWESDDRRAPREDRPSRWQSAERHSPRRPWESDERREPDRPGRREDHSGRWDDRPRRDNRPAGGRPASAAPSGKKKARWSAEDRRKAAQSQERGFGFRKTGGAKAAGKKNKAGKNRKSR